MPHFIHDSRCRVAAVRDRFPDQYVDDRSIVQLGDAPRLEARLALQPSIGIDDIESSWFEDRRGPNNALKKIRRVLCRARLRWRIGILPCLAFIPRMSLARARVRCLREYAQGERDGRR